MNNPTLRSPFPSLWLQERGIRDPYTNTLTFTRAYTNAASTDIRATFARAYLQLHIDRHEKDQLVINFANDL